MKKNNQRMHGGKKAISFVLCSLFCSAAALAQPTTFGSGAGVGGNFTNSYYGANAGAVNSTGQQNVYMGDYAGFNATADHNTFVGSNAGFGNTSGTLNTLIGYVAGAGVTTGHSNICVGPSAGANTAAGNNNVYIGRISGWQSNGSGNTFVGTETAPAGGGVTGSNNTLLGYQSYILSNPTNATAIGYGAAVTQSNSLILGNNSVSVGIGVTAPVKKLTISTSAVNDGIRITQTGSTGYAGVELFNSTSGGKIWSLLSLGSGNTQGTGNFLIYNGTHSRSDYLIEGGTGNSVFGGTGSAGYKIYCNGSGYATGSWVSSDRRFKNNITEVRDALPLIAQLQGVRYSFNENMELPNSRDEQGKPIMRNFPKGTQVGLIAQDVEKVLPEVVNTDEDGYKAIAYQNIVPLLIEGIKEQQAQIAQMNLKMQELQTALNNLQQGGASNTGVNNTGAQQPSLEQNIPNPLSNSTLVHFNIGTAANASIQFVNMEGKTMLSQKLTKANGGQIEVNTENWPTGMYTYSLSINGRTVDTKKMIIAR